VHLIDAVLAEARNQLPETSTLRGQIVLLISAESIEAGEPNRVADVLVVVGELLAVLERIERDGVDKEVQGLPADRGLLVELFELLPRKGGS
jgi:hypothetical protein